jgi:glycosyltransferase involved in cell wall biosynthesis
MRNYNAVYTNGQGDSIDLFTKLSGRKKLWLHHHHTSGDEADRQTWGQGYKNVLIKANKIIACSGRNAREMSEALQRDIDTIPCFSKKVTFQRNANESKQQIKLGYYGRLIPEKGINVLCRMSEEFDVNNLEFHIWGEGEVYPPSFFNRYPKLRYHGKFAGAGELESVVNKIDGFLLLSTHPEGLPISLLEAMSAGLPWLATDRGGITDIAIDPLSTRVIPENSTYEQFKIAVDAFANDLRYNRISRVAQEDLYNKKFSAQALVQKWNAALSLR